MNNSFIKHFKKYCILNIIGITALSIIALIIGVCSNFNDMSNHNAHYSAPAKQTLHDETVVQPITVGYYDAPNSTKADTMMHNRIQNYLNSINNLNDYQKPKFKTTDVSLNGDHSGNQAETVEVILYRK